jgi:hypothetical protein
MEKRVQYHSTIGELLSERARRSAGSGHPLIRKRFRSRLMQQGERIAGKQPTTVRKWSGAF